LFWPIIVVSTIKVRFIKVKDDARLSTILEKILPKMLVVYLEPDMVNVVPSNDHPKLKALNELIEHLMNRVANSNAKVMPPVVEILQIFNSPQF
jgi:hypothetical protein